MHLKSLLLYMLWNIYALIIARIYQSAQQFVQKPTREVMHFSMSPQGVHQVGILRAATTYHQSHYKIQLQLPLSFKINM